MEQNIKDKILKAREFKTRADIAAWFRELLDAGVNFHPEDGGAGLIDIETQKPTFTRAEQILYNALMENVWDCCSIDFNEPVDPCEIACEVFNQWLADNSLAVAVTGKVAQNIKAQTTQLERVVRDNDPAVVLQALANRLRVASDESRSNGPNTLTEDERREHDAAQAIEDLISDYF